MARSAAPSSQLPQAQLRTALRVLQRGKLADAPGAGAVVVVVVVVVAVVTIAENTSK